MNNLGKAAETRACIYLKLHGYKILERNYTGRFGEIDIIGSKNNEITFFEVKQRKNNSYGGGAAAVTYSKQQKIIKTASQYLMQFDKEPAVSFDVIEITGGRLNHIKNAFY